MELRFEPTTQNTNDSKPASTMPAYPIVCVLPYILPAAFIFCRFNLRCPRFSHSAHWALVLWQRKAYQRWRYCLRRTSSSDSLSSNHVLLLCKTILKHFLKGFLEGKSLAPKWRKSADKSLSQPSCSHSNTIYEVELQKTIVLRTQPQHEATLTQPLQCNLQRLSCKTQ